MKKPPKITLKNIDKLLDMFNNERTKREEVEKVLHAVLIASGGSVSIPKHVQDSTPPSPKFTAQATPSQTTIFAK